jgi:DNA-binding transcriptional MerR regulator
MQHTKETPAFNMKVVVQETGLKPDTLRAWERRYNLPQPERTEGGHRLYSRQDIELLKWLISRQDEGMNISHAVELWNRLLAGANG